MEAGRELDALVAEKVMGWVRRTVDLARQWDDSSLPGGRGTAKWKAEALVLGDRIHPLNPAEQQPYNVPGLPHYSTDIAAAWDVVEKMVARTGYAEPGFQWVGPKFKPTTEYLTNEGYPLGTTCWYVLVVSPVGWRRFFCAPTAPHAICLAALKAVGA